MDQLTVAELIELMQNESASIDMQFQIWITITTAVVIASYAARRNFSLLLKMFVATMYALATSALMMRYANDASQFVFLRTELLNRGVEYPSVGDLRLLRGMVYSIGTAATLAFIFLKPKKENRRIEDS